MLRKVATALVVALIASSGGLLTVSAAPRSDASINNELETYIVAHPTDFVGIDRLVFEYTGKHIAVAAAGVIGQLTAAVAAEIVAAHDTSATKAGAGDVMPMSGIPAYQIYVTTVPLSGGGAQIWGTWDFPDTWAGQGAPFDIAATSVSMNTCVQMSNLAIWTYKVGGGSTNLGSQRAVFPATGVEWNVQDYVSGFASMADRGTTRVEVHRGSGCPPTVQVGAAFNYDANQGNGSIVSIGFNFGFLSVSFSAPVLDSPEGAGPIYFNI